MKARRKSDGEIIEVMEWRGASGVIYSSPDMSQFYQASGLDFNVDAEGEEDEMLYVSRKEVQEMYMNNSEKIGSLCEVCNADEISKCDARCGILLHLFGSKCLPDGAKDGAKEPKPAEPKFMVGDNVVLKQTGKIKMVVNVENNGRYVVATPFGQSPLWVDESDLEPYTETKEDTAENRNWSQDCGNCAESVQKTYPDFGHLRLTIAAQMMQALVCAPLIPGVDPNPPAECLAQTAFRLADALIAEAEK